MKTKRAARKSLLPTVELTWSHGGELHCVTPELLFARERDERWTEFIPDPSTAMFASAADGISDVRWSAFLEFVSANERDVIESFGPGRLAALAVIARCPELVEELRATPALVPFLAEHVVLRGATEPRWEEINAVHERGGIFGVLEWLGLPASRQTLAILQRIDQPDLPRRLLEPIRSALWEPETMWLLQRTPSLTERALLAHCHALAA
jgi:hypothetical protein